MITKDLIPGMGIKVFAIMEMPRETRPAGRAQAGTGNSRALGNEQAMTG